MLHVTEYRYLLSGLEPEYGTLAEHLKSEGYTNHLVGKWHLGQSKVDS